VDIDSQAIDIWSVLRPGANVAINLSLAAIPVAAAFIAAGGIKRDRSGRNGIRWIVWMPVLLIWLAFLPNTCYLLTEWRHYLQGLTEHPEFLPGHEDRSGVLAFLTVTAFYVFYSGFGMLTFFLAVWPLDRLVNRRLRGLRWAWQAGLFTACAFGVYLGLVDRFNSWDSIDPLRLSGILQTAASIPYRPVLFAVIVGFGLILWLFYTLFDIFMDGAILRVQKMRSGGGGLSRLWPARGIAKQPNRRAGH